MKKFISAILASALLLFILTTAAAAANTSEIEPCLLNEGGLKIDNNGSGGYSGDYVVIYNPGTSYADIRSTGNMAGRIKTEVKPNIQQQPGQCGEKPVRPYKIDVDSVFAEKTRENESRGKAAGNEFSEKNFGTETLSFNVGDTHIFKIDSSYSPLSTGNVEFKVLAKGEHCYIWTPTSKASNVYPLDSINPSFGNICAAEFDFKFGLMQSSFGNHTNGSQGDGRLNILYYNIDDGWMPGEGYTAGFFNPADIQENGMPCLNIDTYPGVYYVTSNNEVIIDVSDTFSTMVHEYQHLINYSECGHTDIWLDECMSAAAEEICYPGSSISQRIQSWMNYYFTGNGDYLNPPAEHKYQPDWELHNGFSMYDWENDNNPMKMEDLLALYAQVSLYAQYIYTQYGNGTYRKLLEYMKQGDDFITAFPKVTGQGVPEFTRNFRIAVTANSPLCCGGIYGFQLQPGYDPTEYYGVLNLYNWLSPVVFTGNSCNIAGGGAITVKPVNGVYYPPAGADAGLKYYGIKRIPYNPDLRLGDVNMDGEITVADAILTLRCAMEITELTDEQFILADADKNGIVNVTDAIKILRMAMGL